MKAASKRRSRRVAAQQDVLVWYGIRIDRWNWHYHHRAAREKETDADASFAELEISGEPFRPSDLRASRAELIVYGHGASRRGEGSVGLVNVADQILRAVIWLPTDGVSSLLSLLTANELRYAVLHGNKLRYRQAHVRSVQFSRSVDEDEDVPDT